MQKFYFVRHGETDWNVKLGRMQGHTDIPLNEVGLAQAQGLANLFAEIPYHQIISSDLSRAHETAKILGGNRFPILVDSNLREINMGIGEGKTREEADAIVGSEWRLKWNGNSSDNFDMRFEGGESKREVIARVSASVFTFLNKFPNQTLVFVSHGFAIRSLIYSVCPEILPNFWLPNCAVVPFEREGTKIRYLGPLDPTEVIAPKL